MSDLAEWLLGQIAEDERVARAAAQTSGAEWQHAEVYGSWRIQSVATFGNPGYEEHASVTFDQEGLSDSVVGDCGPHIARFDPARVLAECAAKRRIVEAARAAWSGAALWTPERLRTDTRSPLPEFARRDAYVEVLRLLALPYDDRPGYRDEWRP